MPKSTEMLLVQQADASAPAQPILGASIATGKPDEAEEAFETAADRFRVSYLTMKLYIARLYGKVTD